MRVTLGNLNASDLTGPVRMTSSRSWDVSLTNFTNSLDINLNGGDVDLRPGLLPLAKMDVRSRSGHIELALPQAAKFDLTATSSRGSVDNEFGAPLKLEPTGRRGATLRGSNGGPSVNISTESGQVVVRSASAADSASHRIAHTCRTACAPRAGEASSARRAVEAWRKGDRAEAFSSRTASVPFFPSNSKNSPCPKSGRDISPVCTGVAGTDSGHGERPDMKLTSKLLLSSFAMLPLFAASHREAPITALDHKADITDWFTFVSPEHPDRVVMILNVDPFLEPSNGPNYFPFDPNILYEMKVDNNRDGIEDITFQFRFQTEIRAPGVFTGFVGNLAGIPPITALDGPGSEGFSLRQNYSVTMMVGQSPHRSGLREDAVRGSEQRRPPHHAGLQFVARPGSV